VKNLLTALIVASALIHSVPATASDAKLLLRGGETAMPVDIETSSTGPVRDAQAATARKVRVVLPSPYGN